MKTITLDFDLYREELLAAKAEGFALIPKLKEGVQMLAGLWHGSTNEKWEDGRHELLRILNELEKVSLDSNQGSDRKGTQMNKPDTFFLDAYGNGKPIHVVDKRAYDALAENLKAAEAKLEFLKTNSTGALATLFKERNQLRERVKELEHRLCLADEGFKTVVEENTELIQLRERVKELEANVAEYDHGMAGDLIRERNALRAKAEGLVSALEKIGSVDHPSAADKTSWIVMTESICKLAREALAAWKEKE